MLTPSKKHARFFYIILCFCSASLAGSGGEILPIGQFSAGSLEHWESKEFKDQTRYSIVDDTGTKVLKAESSDAASGLFKEQAVDLTKTPVLNWRWRISNGLGKLNEQAKSGDDYAARVYVVVSGGVAFWRTKAINYVFASNTPKNTVWPNAFAGKSAMMVALRSTSTDKTGTWYTEKRNILADLKQQFGDNITQIDAVAIMTDTDNAHGKATAFYGDIYFSKD